MTYDQFYNELKRRSVSDVLAKTLFERLERDGLTPGEMVLGLLDVIALRNRRDWEHASVCPVLNLTPTDIMP